MHSKSKRQNNNPLFRKHLIMPTEHGSWSWLLVPFAAGAGVSGQWNLALFLTLVAGLAVFFMRQPATVWLRVQRGKARKSDGPLAASWISLLGLIAALCLAGLLVLGRAALLWMLVPLAVVFGMYLAASRSGRSGLRSLWMELVGAGALALMAPAALIAAAGNFSGDEWPLWGLLAAQNALGALYVRLRIYDTHGNSINRPMIVFAHAVLLVIVAAAGAMTIVPQTAYLPFLFFMLRAIWAASAVRPVANVKRFGFGEMGVEILGGAWIAVSYGIG